MINLPYNATSMSQIMPCQDVQTSQNNFQSFQQPQTTTQQMQTSPCTICSGNPQDPCKQRAFYQFSQPNMFGMNHQHTPRVLPCCGNPCQPIFHAPSCLPPTTQTQLNYESLPQNIVEQIQARAGNATPPVLLILPNNCHQSANHQQQSSTISTPNQGGLFQSVTQPPVFNYPTPSSIYCLPPFYPYPIPMPIYDPFAAQICLKERIKSCGNCKNENIDFFMPRSKPIVNCCSNVDCQEQRCCCSESSDGTVCSKRNCASSISLQALVSQLLSIPGIITCAATRLILKKIPGSNVTTTVEDTMDRAQKSISVLTKDQLLVESKNAQQANALINLHMTTNPPPNIIPILTTVQLKINLLKAQVESLINKKLMENQGYGIEVESSGSIDPAILVLKTDAELRQFLSALRQKECDERVNLNFAPYHSQRVIAESRLNNILNKIRQVETEYDRRRRTSVPGTTIASRVVQQFSQTYCEFFGSAPTKNLFQIDPSRYNDCLESPNPFFTIKLRAPRRLNLKPHVGSPETTLVSSKATNVPSICTTENTQNTQNIDKDKHTKDSQKDELSMTSEDNCGCHHSTSSSDESFDEDKKKASIKDQDEKSSNDH